MKMNRIRWKTLCNLLRFWICPCPNNSWDLIFFAAKGLHGSHLREAADYLLTKYKIEEECKDEE